MRGWSGQIEPSFHRLVPVPSVSRIQTWKTGGAAEPFKGSPQQARNSSHHAAREGVTFLQYGGICTSGVDKKRKMLQERLSCSREAPAPLSGWGGHSLPILSLHQGSEAS